MKTMAAKDKFFRPGQALFKEGESSESMYLITKGSVAIRKRKGSAFVEIARIYQGEVIGELAFFDRAPRSASCVALTDVEALEISYQSLEGMYQQVPDYLKKILKAVTERLRRANDTIRRLQSNVVTDADSVNATSDYVDTAAILAATADIGKEVVTQESDERKS